VSPFEELLNATRSILATINTKAPLAIAKCIAATNAVYDHTANGYDAEITYFGECFATDDMKEGAAAFLEKRNPNFQGK
jgi:enoyl-CoA hydratase